MAEHQWPFLLVPLFCPTRSPWNALLGVSPPQDCSSLCSWSWGTRAAAPWAQRGGWGATLAAAIINPEQLQNYSRKFTCSKCTSAGAEALYAEICYLKAGEVQGRKECVLSKCSKAAPKRSAPTCKFVCASTTQCVLHLCQKAAPEVPSFWTLEIDAWDVLFKMVYFSQQRANME